MKHMTKLLALALVAILCIGMLASCAPASDPEDAKAALEENGYTVAALPLNYEGLDTVVYATKGLLSSDFVAILYFIDSESAEAAFEEVKADNEDEAEDENFVLEQSGKMIYYGHKNAIAAAR